MVHCFIYSMQRKILFGHMDECSTLWSELKVIYRPAERTRNSRYYRAHLVAICAPEVYPLCSHTVLLSHFPDNYFGDGWGNYAISAQRMSQTSAVPCAAHMGQQQINKLSRMQCIISQKWLAQFMILFGPLNCFFFIFQIHRQYT